MTQQGLSGMKTASKGQRQIQDRSYWLGEIRSKCTELSAEIRKVETEILQRQEENNTYVMFEKRAETLAAELADLQVFIFVSFNISIFVQVKALQIVDYVFCRVNYMITT